MLPGKKIGNVTYFHVSVLEMMDHDIQAAVLAGVNLSGLNLGSDVNVIKIDVDLEDLSLLDYLDFFSAPFPVLLKSWRISLPRKTVVFRNYANSTNPPILHRKELLLGFDDPLRQQFRKVTLAAESLGLFDESKKIGYQEYWNQLVEDRGYCIVDNEFVPIANASESVGLPEPFDPKKINRHLTALNRHSLSAPVQALLRHDILNSNVSFFDYGCGQGTDVKGLNELGIIATGWDPHFAPTALKTSAEIVNIGFVINVIEDIEERIDALQAAFSYATKVVSVAAMLASNSRPEGTQFGDGYVTSRNTFQKYFTQSSLRDFIEQTLDDVAIPVGPGVFLVFRDKNLEQQFVQNKFTRKLKNNTFRVRAYRDLTQIRRRRGQPEASELSTEDSETLAYFWAKVIEFGRVPDLDEIERSTDVVKAFGSTRKALKLACTIYTQAAYLMAHEARKSDLVVLLALQKFEHKKSFSSLDLRLQRDIKSFFGSFTNAIDCATDWLFKISDVATINAACTEAFENGNGWLEESHSLQVHISLIEKLPIVLRVYIGCATIMCGDISSFDIVKVHIRSGKVSLLLFDDFENSPIPKLIQRVKVKLRQQDLEIFNYGDEFKPPLLFNKSRFINEEFFNYAEQIAFEEALVQHHLFDLSEHSPDENKFLSALRSARLEIVGMELTRSSTVPLLDDRCGVNFTYRHFIECGETQNKCSHANVPIEPDSYTAIHDLAVNVLDPVIEYFGAIKLTYGFCSHGLSKLISGKIAPKLDQHSSYEKNKSGAYICARLGAAVDFIVEDEDMLEVANWIVSNLNFDRVYFYGRDKPLHVSFSLNPSEQVTVMKSDLHTNRRIPRTMSKKDFLQRQSDNKFI